MFKSTEELRTSTFLFARSSDQDGATKVVAMVKSGLALVAVILLLAGCRATTVMLGTKEPNLATLQLGTPRQKVEKVLTKPLWHLGTADGLNYEIYQYPVEREAQPAIGAAGLFMDYITLGLFEYNLLDVREFEPVKQILVGYDEQDGVGFISTPWIVKDVGPCRRLRSNLPVELRDRLATPLRSLVGNAVNASLKLEEKGIRVAIDGHPVEGRLVELAEGRHSLSYEAELGGSVMYGTALIRYKNAFEDFEVFSGRSYVFKRKRYYPGAGNRVDIFWLEDEVSRETLKCSWPTAH